MGSPRVGDIGDRAAAGRGSISSGSGSWVGTSVRGFGVGFFLCIPVVCWCGEDVVPVFISAGLWGRVCVCWRAEQGRAVGLSACQGSGTPSSCLNMKMLGFLTQKSLYFNHIIYHRGTF